MKLRRFIGQYAAIALLVSGLLLPIAASVWQPAAASALSFPPKGEGTWFYKQEKCTQGGVSVNAALMYTDDTGKTVIFNCQYTASGADQDFIALGGPKDCSGSLEAIFIGRRSVGGGAPTGTSYHTTTSGTLVASARNAAGDCVQQGNVSGLQIKLTNSYDDGSQPPSIGTAYWSKVDPLNPVGILHAHFTLGSFTNTDELFSQSAINGNLMELTGTKKGDPNCSEDTVEVGSVGSHKDYWEDTTALLTTYIYGYNGSSLGCSPVIGLIKLVDQSTGKPASYIDAGGQAPTDSTGNGNGCPQFEPNGFNFAICDLWGIFKGAAQKINDNLTATLYINTSTAKDSGGVFSPTFKAAFDSFRNIALSAIIIVSIIAVGSQAAGLEIFSAVGLRKKAVPTLMAVIAIALAWPLMQFAVTFFNDLGTWTQSLIMAAISPIKGASSGSGITTLSLLFGTGTVGASAAIIGLGTAGLFSLALTVVVALFVAFVTLILRQIIVVMCIMLAPLAIAFSVFPGTEGLFKFWRTTFIGMLVMFPMIMGLLASGEAVSRVARAEAEQSNGGVVSNGWVFLAVAIIAEALPYLMLPGLIRMTNRTLAGISKTINSGVLRGFYEGQAKKRQNIQAQNWEKFRAGSRYSNPRNPVNWVGSHLGAGVRGGFGFGKTGAAVRASRATLSADAAGKAVPDFANLTGGDPNAALAVASGNNADFLNRTGIRNATTANAIDAGLVAGKGIPINQQTRVAAFEQLGKSGKFTGNSRQAWELANDIAAGNEQLRTSMLGSFMSNSRAAGRGDLGRFSTEDSVDPITHRVTAPAGQLDVTRALSEMSIADVARQQTSSLNSLFTPRNVQRAMREMGAKGNAAGSQHIANLLYNAQYNENIQPQQRDQIASVLADPAIAPYLATAAQTLRRNRTGSP